MTHPLSGELRKRAKKLDEYLRMNPHLCHHTMADTDALRSAAEELDAQYAGRKRALDAGKQALDNGDTALDALEVLTAERDELRSQLEKEQSEGWFWHNQSDIEASRAERAEARSKELYEHLCSLPSKVFGYLNQSDRECRRSLEGLHRMLKNWVDLLK